MPAEAGMECGAACRRTRGDGEVAEGCVWMWHGVQDEQVGRDAVDDASGRTLFTTKHLS